MGSEIMKRLVGWNYNGAFYALGEPRPIGCAPVYLGDDEPTESPSAPMPTPSPAPSMVDAANISDDRLPPRRPEERRSRR